MSTLRSRLALPLLLLLAASAACASSASPETGTAGGEEMLISEDVRGAEIGPNDVTYLFPYERDNPESVERLIGADWMANGNAIWPDAIFAAPSGVIDTASKLSALRGRSDLIAMSPVDGHENIDVDIVQARNKHNWRVVAFRFDPCAAPAANEAGCSVELRLVMQPFVNLRFDADTSAHFIYRYGNTSRGSSAVETRDRLIVDLVHLGQEARRVAPTTAGALSVHPALRDGAFRDRVRDFLLTHLRPENLSEVAFMGLTQTRQFGVGSDVWEFFHGDVAGAASRFELAPIANLADGDVGPQRSQMLNFRGGTRMHPRPRTAANRDDLEGVTSRNTDCLSCHATSTEIGTASSNLRMLGYFEGAATISERTKLETAAVVGRVNDILR